MDSVSYTHESPNSADAFWKVLAAFTEIDWLVGPGNYEVGEHEGREARILKMQMPIVEFLINCGHDKRELSYGVVKNPFVPVDNYQATVTVETASDGGEGCVVLFRSTFELDEVPLEQVNQMLTSAYQMMGNQIDQSLAQPSS